MKTKFNIGDIVTPKNCPQLSSKIEKVEKDIADMTLYILENGCCYIENELK